MPRTTTIVIGAGPAGLAMSRNLTDRHIDHVVLERGRVVERWRSERWDSLRLLTPNWQMRLPGWSYAGDDPDGYMTMPEIVDHLDGFAASFAAPVQEETTVVRASTDPVGGYRVLTDQGTWRCESIVIATGATGRPVMPAFATNAPPGIRQLAPSSYRNPDLLPDAPVLVVGASASGLQLADELRRSGREVTLAVGSHTRLPRTYRGMDIQWWLDATGTLDRRFDEVPDLDAARRSPSLQLVGSTDRRALDLRMLADAGVRLTGRLVDIDGPLVRFADDLATTTAAADRAQTKLLDRLDRWVERRGLTGEVDEAVRPRPLDLTGDATELHLVAESVGTIIWATGYRPHNPWLAIDGVVDSDGSIRHRGGVTPAAGVYVLGLPFLRRRKSTFLDGVGGDAADLADHLVGRLATSGRPAQV